MLRCFGLTPGGYFRQVLRSTYFLNIMPLLQDFYETTLDALKDAKNERLWFKTMTKLGKLYFDREDYGKLSRILKQLHTSCTTQEGNWKTYGRN